VTTPLTLLADRTEATSATLTHCPYCSLQCGIRLEPDAAGPGALRLEPQADFPTNRGGLCSKGWNANTLIGHPGRLLTPLVRSVRGDRTSAFRQATWEEALDQVEEGVRAAQERYGLDSVGCFGGGGLTNEKAYAFGKFARVALRTSMIDYNGRFCMSSAATACNRALGIDRGLPFPLADIAEAGAVLLVGSNPAATMPPAMQYFDQGRENGAVHIVVDPRRTPTASGATHHLMPLPGTDLALANGLLHIAIKEKLVDTAYIEARTTGFAAVRAAAMSYWPNRVEELTGIPVAQLRTTVRALASAPSAMILTARGAEQHSNGTDTAQAFLNLALALGLPGRPFSGYGTITGQGNGQGGREHGQKADQLPGYRRLADPDDRRHVAAVWGVDPDDLPEPGLSAFEMLDRMGRDGGVRALIVLASNLVVSAPDANRVADRLAALDLLVVSDIFLAETATFADVVFPTTQWAEEEGTMTNLEGRVLRRKRALDPPAGVRSDLELMNAIAARFGRGAHFPTDPATVFDELRRASAGGIADYSGISYERIDAEKGVFWPCPSDGHPGTPRLFADRFPTPDGRARFIRVDHRNPAEIPSAQFPYVLTTGRLMAQYQSGTQTRRHPNAEQAALQPEVELHPDLARRLRIGPADIVQLRTRRGAANFRARVTEDIRVDTVFIPFHWAGASNANALTNPALDPLSRMPEFKVCSVAVVRVGSPADLHLLAAPPESSGPSGPSGAIVPLPPSTTTIATPAPPSRSTRTSHLTRRRTSAMISKNRFLQGFYPFTGAGSSTMAPIHSDLSYTVPEGVVLQPLYYRGGNSTSEMITVVLLCDGRPMRLFPIGAKGDVNVPLRVVEDIEGGSVVELQIVAPEGVTGTVVVDLGMVEH
jgi:assimilatory nitrate reductase catalytic subunit